MKKLTKQQRQKIYLRAAKYFDSIQGKSWWNYFGAEGFCDYIYNQVPLTRCYEYKEYQLFKPKIIRNCYWFDTYNEKSKIIQSDRITALLLAAEMCND